MGCQLLTAMDIWPLANGKVRNINEGLIKDLNKVLRKGAVNGRAGCFGAQGGV